MKRFKEMPPRNTSIKSRHALLFGCFLCSLILSLHPFQSFAAESRIDGDPIGGSLRVTVVRADQATPTPIQGAFVMVGPEPGSPFSGNYGFTDPEGTITFNSQTLIGPQFVTAGAEGYQYMSLVDVDADDLTLALSSRETFTMVDGSAGRTDGDADDPTLPPADAPVLTEPESVDMVTVAGRVSGFSVDNGPQYAGDNRLDAGIVLPLLDIETALCPAPGFFTKGVDVFPIRGEVEVELNLPDNMILPPQIEYYSEIAKPLYRWPSADKTNVRLGCLAGRIGTDHLHEWLLAGGSLAELFPVIELYKVGASDIFFVDGSTAQDLSLTHGLEYNLTVDYENAPESYSVILFAGGDLSGTHGSGPILPVGYYLQEGGAGFGSVPVTTAPKTGDLSNMNYLFTAAAVHLDENGEPVLASGLSALVDRTDSVSPPGVVTLDSFFAVVDKQFESLGDGRGAFDFSDVYRDGESPSPLPALSVSSILLEASVSCEAGAPDCTAEGRVSYEASQWVVVTPGDATGFQLPVLPAEAPAFLSRPASDDPGEPRFKLLWDLSVYGLDAGEAFDFNRYDFSTFQDRVTHLSRRKSELPLEGVAPDSPENLSPADQVSVVPKDQVLEASAFSDRDVGDLHTASRWRIWPEDGSSEDTVLDEVISSGDLTRFEIPRDVLESGRSYLWHVRYRDSAGMWSDYSGQTAFTPINCLENGDCDDGLWCNGPEQCDLGTCRAGTAPDCEDGLTCTVNTCNEETDSCDGVTEDSLCDDGLWCNGVEACDAVEGCLSGTAPDCEDGVSCTTDTCNEDTDSCDHLSVDSLCDDGLWCNGAEMCNAVEGCLAGAAPDCSDGVSCTVDACNEDTDSCQSAPEDSLCDDGRWCNGAEMCDAAAGCLSGTAPNCNDSISCTFDLCNEWGDACLHLPINSTCNNGLYCDGVETCSLTEGCEPGIPPNCDDSVLCTVDTCNEAARICENTPDDSVCNDGMWCNGQETCSAELDCQEGVVVDCNDGDPESIDTCNEVVDSCENTRDALALSDGGETENAAQNGEEYSGQVSYSFQGVPGNVLLEYEAFDVDHDAEIQILFNGREVSYVPATPDNAWGEKQFLLFLDENVYDASVNLLTFNNTYNPPHNESWGVKNVVMKISDFVPMPDQTAYGRFPGYGDMDLSGSSTDLNEVVYSFAGTSGDVLIEFEAFDITDATEVKILVNNKEIDFVPVTPQESWGGLQFVTVQDVDVYDSSFNALTFRNTGDPTQGLLWGVRRAVVKPLSGDTPEQEDFDSPFGLDYVFPLDPIFSDPEFVEIYGDMGIRWVNFADVMWAAIEPFKPVNGVHDYHWSTMDACVKEWQKYGIHIMMSLRFRSYWATAEITNDDFGYLNGLFYWIPQMSADYLPKPEHWQDLRDFVYNLIERYDNDGYRDMPGLELPILHYQMGNEFSNQLYFTGTAEEYEELLRETAQSARSANNNVKIVLSGTNFKEVYGFYDNEPDPLSQAYVDESYNLVDPNMLPVLDRTEDFDKRSMQLRDLYDIVDARWPEYGIVRKAKELLDDYGYANTDVWSAEMYSYFPLSDPVVLPGWSLHAYPVPSKCSDYRRIIKNPQDQEFPVVNAWYRGMQAAHVIKTSLVALHAGSKKLMMGWSFDVQDPAVPSVLSYTGLVSGTFSKPWPAAYTYKLLIGKLNGIKTIRRLPMPENVYVYECVVTDGKRVFVAFYDDHIGQNHDEPMGVIQANIPFGGSQAKMTHIVTEIDETVPDTEIVPVTNGELSLQLSEHPVFIEAVTE